MDTSNLTPRDVPAGAPPVACWSCRGPVATGELFCGTCNIIQPPQPMDHFARLGLPSGFVVDGAALDRGYFDRQRQLHPDRFATRSPRERALSEAQAVAVNDAYDALKDPVTRAEYMIHLAGIGAVPEGCLLVADQELLLEALEMREHLADAETVDDVAAVQAQAAADAGATLDDLAGAFADDDLERAARKLTRLKYFRKLAEECTRRRRQLAGGL